MKEKKNKQKLMELKFHEAITDWEEEILKKIRLNNGESLPNICFIYQLFINNFLNFYFTKPIYSVTN